MHGCVALLAFLQLPLASQSVFANHFIAWRPFLQRGEDFVEDGDFRSGGGFHKEEEFLQPISQRVLGGCETILQRGGDFRSGSLLLRNFAAHALSLLFELLLIPNFFLSPFLTFLLILIIQKPILHQNKLELKH